MSLKILHVITTIERGGAEKQLLTLAKNQVSVGHDVYIYYLKGRADLLQEFKLGGVQVLLPSHNFFFDLIRLAKILRLNFDIVHAHLPRAELEVALSKRLSCAKTTLVASRHNSERFFPRFPKLYSSLLSRITLNQFAGVIFISLAVRDFVDVSNEVKKTIPSRVIYYGYDQEIILDQPANLKQDYKKDSFLFVGRLTRQKNIPFLLETFRRYHAIHPHAELHIYGSGELETLLKDSTKDLSEKIIWHGKSSGISRILTAHTCLILPSLYEGFGLILLEAMQSGIPVLAANNSAIPEVLGYQHPGLFELDRVDTLFQLMKEVNSVEFRADAIKYQADRLKFFEPGKMTNLVLQFYEDLNCKSTFMKRSL